MARYTTRTTADRVLIIDTTTNKPVCFCANLPEATTFATILNTRADRQPRRTLRTLRARLTTLRPKSRIHDHQPTLARHPTPRPPVNRTVVSGAR